MMIVLTTILFSSFSKIWVAKKNLIEKTNYQMSGEIRLAEISTTVFSSVSRKLKIIMI
jgi:hypothetical protein